MRFVLAVVLLFLAPLVRAQPACLPSDLGGTGSAAAITVNAKGQAAGWWCPDGSKWIAAVRWSEMTDAIGAALAALHTSSDKRAAVDALVALRGTQMGDLADVWAPIAERMRTPPPMRRWQVKPNGTAATRPAYPLTDGVRGTREVRRAPVGAPCDTARPTLASGPDLWAEFDASAPGIVALCSLR